MRPDRGVSLVLPGLYRCHRQLGRAILDDRGAASRLARVHAVADRPCVTRTGLVLMVPVMRVLGRLMHGAHGQAVRLGLDPAQKPEPQQNRADPTEPHAFHSLGGSYGAA